MAARLWLIQSGEVAFEKALFEEQLAVIDFE
jgi:biotin synthase-related radical SAM superfamily protein